MAYNILIIDDSAVMRRMLKKILDMTSVSVGEIHEAGDGKEGLQKLRTAWVDLVFLDINMPVMNGLEFLENVRNDDGLSDTKVIVVSTEGSTERVDALNELGITAYLRKPVTPEQLAETITAVLGTQSE